MLTCSFLGPVKIINYASKPQVIQVEGNILGNQREDDIYQSMLRIHGNEQAPPRVYIQKHFSSADPHGVTDKIIRAKQNLFSIKETIYEGNCEWSCSLYIHTHFKTLLG